MSNVLIFPSLEILGFSSKVSKEVITNSTRSYNQGRSAFFAGKMRRKPSCKSDCFDFNAWLIGWDHASQEDKSAA